MILLVSLTRVFKLLSKGGKCHANDVGSNDSPNARARREEATYLSAFCRRLYHSASSAFLKRECLARFIACIYQAETTVSVQDTLAREVRALALNALSLFPCAHIFQMTERRNFLARLSISTSAHVLSEHSLTIDQMSMGKKGALLSA